ncbi:unnamed protein product [Coffea canephora]|uniref:Light-regulated protein n=1 Tax=Coffea canephora TaxID=49390 RepID=A0A068VDQ3_COFCA|nr:light-regulated protein, chloroplastic [Coffea eugenioides]CDP18975.1 unnamed protein product [Coffea canephora]
MQAALSLAPPILPLQTPARCFRSQSKSIPAIQTSSLFARMKAAAVANDTSTVDYSSTTSVFPAEACETLGGDACDVEMYPEAKLNPGLTDKRPQTASEQVEREYLEYNSPKTVFEGDACDELGGEFCQPEHQSGA